MERNDLSRSLVAFDQASTMVVVVELSFRSWLVAGLVPGLSRQPLKKQGADAQALLTLLRRWQGEAIKAGSRIERIVVAFEAGRDGFWLARWLRARAIEAYVIHPTSIPVSREHRRAKTDRLDAGLLMRSVLGWLRGEAKHCSMAAVPTIAEEDARRPKRQAMESDQGQTRSKRKQLLRARSTSSARVMVSRRPFSPCAIPLPRKRGEVKTAANFDCLAHSAGGSTQNKKRRGRSPAVLDVLGSAGLAE